MITRKLVSAFGALFSDITFREWDANINKWKNFIKVPVSYGPKEKFLARVRQRAEVGFGDDVAMVLPRIAFELNGTSYDSARVLNKRNYYVESIDTDGNRVSRQCVGVPYDFSFSLYVMVKQVEHGTKIIEQILPFFTPQLNVTIKISGEHNISLDVPIILNSISLADNYEGDFTTRRDIVWTLDFTMKAFTFGPVSTGKIIKTAITELGIMDFEGKHLFQKNTTIPVVPGKTLDEIFLTDDWGFLTTTETI